jgi:hypothetical protein
MEESKLSILTDAKNEYTIQLVNILKSSICNGIRYLYDEAKKKCVTENRFNEVLSEFQDYLSQIRLWSQDMIENEYKRIETESGCDFIKELLIAVFMSHTQILQIISKDASKKQTQIDIPKPEHFIHKCYINIGREFYKNPMFFYDGPEVSPIERHKNIPQSESVIATTINETIRQLLPLRRILKTYLQDSYNVEQDDEEDINTPLEKKPLSKNYQRNLREIVKKEVENYNALKTDTFQPQQPSINTEIIEETTTQTDELEHSLTNENESNQTPNIHLEMKEEKKEEHENLEVLLNENENKIDDIDVVEELPEITMEYIEDAISKQEYVSESEDDSEIIKEKEAIKKTLIETIDLEDISSSSKPQPPQSIPTIITTPKQEIPTNEPIISIPSTTETNTQTIPQTITQNIERNNGIKHVEMIIEDKQSKLKKQKAEEQSITIHRDIPKEQKTLLQIQTQQQIKPIVTVPLPSLPSLPSLPFSNTDLALFDPTMEFEEMDLTEGDSIEDLHPSEPIFKPTSAHKFKFFN